MAKFFVILICIAVAAASDSEEQERSRRYAADGLGGVVYGAGGLRTISGQRTTQQLTSVQSGGIGGYYGGVALPAYSTLGINNLGINNGLGYSNLGYNNLGVNTLGVNTLGVNSLGVNNLGWSAYPGVGQLTYSGVPVGRVIQQVGAVPVGYGLH